MMSDRWNDRLSEYLDGCLTEREAVELEWHLQSCLDCRRALGELREVVARAHSLPDVAPAKDLWPELAGRLDSVPRVDAATPRVIDLHQHREGRRVRTVAFTVPQLAAASIALMLLSGSIVWFAVGRAIPGASEPRSARGTAQLVDTRAAATDYTAAVQSLEAALRERSSRLDPVTVAILEENLRAIDAAILEARAALESDPGNLYLNQHLENTMKKKIQVLRRATGLSGARS